MTERYLMAKEIRDTYDIAVGTLRQWEEKGLLHPAHTAGGHRRYSEKELLAILGPTPARRGNRCATYARVSLEGPIGERALAEQLQILREKARSLQYVTVGEYGEIASGLDENRREMGRLLRSAANGEIDVILVECKERLAWSGFTYLSHFCKQHNITIKEVGPLPTEYSREELIREAGRFIDSLCCLLVGKRSPSLAGEVMTILRSAVERSMPV